jgi:hypothetical protein
VLLSYLQLATNPAFGGAARICSGECAAWAEGGSRKWWWWRGAHRCVPGIQGGARGHWAGEGVREVLETEDGIGGG